MPRLGQLRLCSCADVDTHYTVDEEGNLIYQQSMARITTASEACGSVRCAIYTSRGEAAALCLGLPLP